MPIVAGAPRSGTTLLRFMLDAHPQLAIPPETGFLVPLANIQQSGAGDAEALFRLITHYPTSAPVWPDFHLDAQVLHHELAKLRPFDLATGVRSFYRLYAERFGKPRYGDKTPTYCEHIPAISALLPEAHFIHIIRDGRDMALSLRPLWFAPARDIASLAHYWQRLVRAGQAGGSNARAYMEIRYEDLVQDSRWELEKICAFLDLPFHPDMLNYWQRTPDRLKEHGARVQSNGTEIVGHQQRLDQQRLTTGPPMLDRAFRWKRDLTEQEQQEFVRAAGATLAELGYEV